MTTQVAPERPGQLSTEPLRLNLGGAGEGYISGKIPGYKIVDLRIGLAHDASEHMDNTYGIRISLNVEARA